jgi:hypothetical protein
VRAAALLLLAASPAWAQDRPATTPSRDVDVTYQAGVGPAAVEQRSRFRAADQKLRLDTPSPGLYMIVDQRARTMAMVSESDRGVVDMALKSSAIPGLVTGPAGAPQSFTRRGEDKVAGLACTEWETIDSQGQPTLACFTGDGVLLRARRGAQVLVVATRVAYGPHDPAVFSVPAGYNHVAAQAGR